jgi:hypothetical protein
MAEFGVSRLANKLIDIVLIAPSSRELVVMQSSPSPGSVRIGNHGVHRTDTLEGILVHWTQGLTTAFMEGLNSLLSAVKRKARGYRTVEHMTAMPYFVAKKLTL